MNFAYLSFTHSLNRIIKCNFLTQQLSRQCGTDGGVICQKYRSFVRFSSSNFQANTHGTSARKNMLYKHCMQTCAFSTTCLLQSSQQSADRKSSMGLADDLLASMNPKTEPATAQQTERSDNSGSQKETKDSNNNFSEFLKKYSLHISGIMISAIGIILVWRWGTPLVDPVSGEIIRDEFSDMNIVKQYILRTISEVHNVNKMIQEPARDQLLPEPLKPPYIQPPYTLVIEMKDVLVHPEWTYETGWRFKKRPGVDFFLQHCAPPLFEIVLYTVEQGFTAFPVIDQLDPNGFIWYRLFRDSTRYVDGKHLKDLDCLNRNLNKVIMVDWDSKAVTSSRNQLCIKRWEGDMKDQTLIDLAIMLRTIAETGVEDVKEVLDYYHSFDDPITAFKENQRAAQQQEEHLQKKVQEATGHGRLTGSWASSFLRRT